MINEGEKGGFMMIMMMTDDNDNYNYLRKATQFSRREILILAVCVPARTHRRTHTHTHTRMHACTQTHTLFP